MKLLFHTIALEPARWTPRRVSRPLLDLLPAIAAADFRDLEVYEPHLGEETGSSRIRDAFARLELVPVVLSSYLNLNPANTSEALLDQGIAKIAERISFYGFRKVRIFPGPGIKPADERATAVFMERLHRMLLRIPPVEVLLETHDGSLADDPSLLVRLMGQLPANVGLLYQPTYFTRQSALDQFRLQRPFIRHLHLQNRHPDLSYATLREGVIPWAEILAEAGAEPDATLEFVPAGICDVEGFDLDATLSQAIGEISYIRGVLEALPR
jgi:sugar phosphate isomerase/epimerase